MSTPYIRAGILENQQIFLADVKLRSTMDFHGPLSGPRSVHFHPLFDVQGPALLRHKREPARAIPGPGRVCLSRGTNLVWLFVCALIDDLDALA
jgi:hypothetical protein